MRIFALALFAVLVASYPAHATIFMMLHDEFDDQKLILEAHDKAVVKAFRGKMDEFEKGLLRLKERDFIALFGKSQAKPAKTYAMPVAEHRGLGLSGIRYGDPAMNKDHTDFYVVKDVAALEVYYQINGESPAAIILYFPAGKDFPKLDKDNLDKRLAWDEDHFKRLRAHVEARVADLFPWEVDRAELAKINQGDFEVDAARKLEAWIKSGKSLGYTCKYNDESSDWSWYGPDGRQVRQAYRAAGHKDGAPESFRWFYPNGGELRSEDSGYRRWCRPNGSSIRFETRDTWCWYGKDGKVVRQEWDDNGDGIPDWYVTAEDGMLHVFDRKAMEKRKPLKLADSWAVNPKLIPEDSRISDQPDLRIPVRRKESAEKKK